MVKGVRRKGSQTIQEPEVPSQPVPTPSGFSPFTFNMAKPAEKPAEETSQPLFTFTMPTQTPQVPSNLFTFGSTPSSESSPFSFQMKPTESVDTSKVLFSFGEKETPKISEETKASPEKKAASPEKPVAPPTDAKPELPVLSTPPKFSFEVPSFPQPSFAKPTPEKSTDEKSEQPATPPKFSFEVPSLTGGSSQFTFPTTVILSFGLFLIC